MAATKLDAARAVLAAAEESVGLVAAHPRGKEWEVAVGGWHVPEELGALFPRGVAPGQTFATFGSRLAAVLLASILSSQGAWMACIGIPDMGWGAAAGLGVDLSHTVTVPLVGEVNASRVLTAAIDGFQVVMVGRGVRLDHGARRVLARRALTRGTLLIGEEWAAREKLAARFIGAEGMNAGKGHLRALRVELRGGGVALRILLTDQGWQLDNPVLAAVPDVAPAPAAVTTGAVDMPVPAAATTVSTGREAGVDTPSRSGLHVVAS